MGVLLQVQGAWKQFDGQEVLRGVDLAVEEGQVAMLLGKSGSGKTVLLKAIAGLLPLDEGEILYRGKPVRRHVRGGPPVSYLFQGDALFDSLSAWDNVALPLREGRKNLRQAEIDGKVSALLEKLDLAEFGSKFPSELSGGMRRRVALARALVVDPEMVLFDEPTTGLDPLRRNAVLQLIHRDSRRFGFTALVVSHDVPESLFIADVAAILDDGVIAVQGAPVDLVNAMEADSPLHAFLHNKNDLFARLGFAVPEADWRSEEASIRSDFDAVALLSFCEDLNRLNLERQLGHARHRWQVLESVRELGPHVSPAYALPGHRVLVGFKGVDPEVASSILFSLPGITPCAEEEAWLRIFIGPSRPEMALATEVDLLQTTAAQCFKFNHHARFFG